MTIEEEVRRIFSRVTAQPERDIVSDATLAALGLESLDQIECVLSIEDAFRIELPQTDLWGARTVQDVIDAVRRALPEGDPRR